METLERVATLVEAGKLERSEAIDVPARQRTDTATTAVADELRAGAKQLGVSLDPAMQTVERYNQLIETDEAVCVFPVVTLVVRDAEDDAVVAIAPVRTGETILPVSELIGALEERRSLR